MSLWQAALTLFLVMDPIGNIPIWVAMLRDVPPHRRFWVILRENLFALAVLVGSLFFGPPILELLQIEGPALNIAGGVVLFLIALRLIFPHAGGMFGDEHMRGEPLFFPLAVPLLAGPSALAVTMILAKTTDVPPAHWLIPLLGAWFVGLLILLPAAWVEKVIGRRALVAAERLMGMVLTLIAVQMIINGIREEFLTHGTPGIPGIL
jgi:multiple antibiotic resistance protein